MLRLAPTVLCAFVLSAALLLCPQRSIAGVIVEKEFTPNHEHLIHFIQGHREKLIRWPKGEQTSLAVVDDLDKGIRTYIDYARKCYYQEPFPEENVTHLDDDPVDFKPTGVRRKIAGYRCDEYRASGESSHRGEWTESECVSNEPPGAVEYNQFEELLGRQYARVGFESPGYEPKGVQLAGATSDGFGTSGEVVTRIESKVIPSSEFEPPAEFVRVKRAPGRIADRPRCSRKAVSSYSTISGAGSTFKRR
jgi:hypothetical protein